MAMTGGIWVTDQAYNRLKHLLAELNRRSRGMQAGVDALASSITSASGETMGASQVAHDIMERENAEDTARDSARRLQQLSRRLMGLEEEGRRRLGRDLHDRIGSNLSALLLSLEVLQRKLLP